MNDKNNIKMKTLPSKITHISSGCIAKPISMNFGGLIKAKVIDKGHLLVRKGSIIEINLDEVNHSGMLWVTPIGENFI